MFFKKLDEGLTLRRTGDLYADILPTPYDVVVFGRELLQDVDRLVLILLHSMLAAIFEEQWHPSVDDNQVDRVGAQTLLFPRGEPVELEVVVPIGRSLHVEELLQLCGLWGFEQLAEKVARLAQQLCKLADAQGRIAIGALTEELPEVASDRGKTSPLTQCLIVGLQLAGILVLKAAFQHTRLSKKDGLDPWQSVAPSGEKGLACGLGYQLERKAVDPASKIMGHQPIAALLPVAVALLQQPPDGRTLGLQTFEEKAFQGIAHI